MHLLNLLLSTSLLGLSFATPKPKLYWEVLPSTPDVPRQEHTTVAIDGVLYVLGGILPDPSATPAPVNTTSLVQAYDIRTHKWSRTASMPLPLNHPNVVAVSGKLYVLGGLTPDPTGEVWEAIPDCFVYDPKRNSWKRVASMPINQARGSAAMGVVGSKIYLAGGVRSLALTGERFQDTVAVVTSFDTVTGKWSVLESLPEGRDHAGAVIFNNCFYVVGGRFQGQRNVRGTVFVLDLSNPKRGWKSLATMPTPRGGIAAALVAGKIYTFGGEGNPAEGSNGVFNETEVYDIKRNFWQKLEPMRLPRHGTSAFTVNRKIYIPGGGVLEGGAPVNDFDAFVP